MYRFEQEFYIRQPNVRIPFGLNNNFDFYRRGGQFEMRAYQAKSPASPSFEFRPADESIRRMSAECPRPSMPH